MQARYYFGQPVANAHVRYVVRRQAYYSPYRWDDGFDGEEGESYFYSDEQTEQGELRLDAQGRGEIRVSTEADENARDYSLRIEAQVTDASSRVVSDNTTVHATYGSVPVVVAGERIRLQTRAGGTGVDSRDGLQRQCPWPIAHHASCSTGLPIPTGLTPTQRQPKSARRH